MDLRSPEYIAAQKFFKPPLIALLVVLAFVVLTIASLQAANYYKNILQAAVVAAEETVIKLQVSVEPILSMKEGIETVNAKQELLKEIENRYSPLSNHLKIIMDTSTASSVDLQRISIAESGDLVIEGYADQVKDAATFNQQLSTISFIGRSRVSYIDLSGNDRYLFTINGKLKQGDSNEE